MNLNRILKVLEDSLNDTQKSLYKIKEKFTAPSPIIGCEFNLYKSMYDIIGMQEKVEFFLDAIAQCNFSKTDEKDFSVYISAKHEEYVRKCEFQKKCINQDNLIK